MPRRASTTAALFRYGPDYAAAPVTPRMDWSAWPGPQGGLLGAVEMCNNNGTCRKFDAGSMCPSYRVTRDETHLTRGRANTLRLALTGQLGPDALAGDDVAAAMKLCVSCKACRRECPVGVDMAKMKIEASAARVAKHGVALRERLVAELPRYAPWAARIAPLANIRNRVPLLRRLGERFVGISAARQLPEFRTDPYRDAEIGQPTGAANEVILFGDTFNRYYEPENLRAAVRVLRRLGLTPVTPKVTGRPLCCGRTYLSAGLVDRARAEARRTLDALAGEAPVLGLEPSCLMTLRDEFGSLLPGPAAGRMKDRARLLTEYLTEHAITSPMSLQGVTLHVHGHCHQKSFGAFPAALAALRRIDGATVKPIESSCCGMAGAFGYGAETLEASKAMAELSLLPAVRAARPDDIVVADGTSCRHQIADLGGPRGGARGSRARHGAERLALLPDYSAEGADSVVSPSPSPSGVSAPASPARFSFLALVFSARLASLAFWRSRRSKSKLGFLAIVESVRLKARRLRPGGGRERSRR